MNLNEDEIHANSAPIRQAPNGNSKVTSYREVVKELRALKVLISELGKLITPMQNQNIKAIGGTK